MKLPSLTRKQWSILAFALIGIWAVYAYTSGRNDKSTSTASVLVKVATAEKRDIPYQLYEVGNVIAYESVAVRSRLDSQIMEIPFKDGDYVEKGALLFVLDDRVLLAEQKQLEANLSRDKAQLQNLKVQYDRISGLAKKGFDSTANLDTAKAAYEAQRGTVAATEASLESVKVQLEYTRITAPISGRTGTINFTVGNTVKANDANALVTINQIRPIRVQTSLSQTHFNSLRSSMQESNVQVAALHESNEEIATGTLEYIDNTVDQSTGTFVARAVFPNEEEKLWPGMFIKLRLTLGEQKQALVIPETALQHAQEGDIAFVINEGKAQKRLVKTERIQQGLAVIADGINEGEQVVTDGLMSLKDGSAVTLQEAKP